MECFQGKFVSRKMTTLIGADFVHGAIQSSKLRAPMWARLVHFGLGIKVWATGGGFLGGESSIGVF
jgi:hypothetical protein